MTSSPSTIMLSSRAISSCRASRRASRRLIFGMSLLPLGIFIGIDVFVQLVRRRIGTALRKTHRLLNFFGNALLNRLILSLREDSGLFQMPCQALDRIAPVSPLGNFVAA